MRICYIPTQLEESVSNSDRFRSGWIVNFLRLAAQAAARLDENQGLFLSMPQCEVGEICVNRTNLIIALVLLLFVPQGKLLCLYNGNPTFPMMPERGAFISKNAWLGVKGGYEFDDVYDRKLQLVGQGLPDVRKEVQVSDSMSQFGVLTLSFGDRVEIFSTLGTLCLDIMHHPYKNEKVSYKTKSDFAWGVGGRVLLVYWGDVQLGVNASYVASDLSLSSIKVNSQPYSKEGSEVDFREWQVGIGASYRWNWFIPYLGVDYSDYRARFQYLDSLRALFPSRHVTFKDRYPMGIYFGFGLSPERAVNVNFEARLINENAITASADFRF